MLVKFTTSCLLMLVLNIITLGNSEYFKVKFSDKALVDGKINDKCWQGTDWFSDFKILSDASKHPNAKTHFKMVHDNNYLFIIIKADEPQMESLQSNVRKRDGKVHSDDCLELFLDVDGEKTDYFHIIINPSGVIYDAERRQGGNVAYSDWNFRGLKVATTKGKNYWIAELAIPFAELGIKPNNKGVWGFNITRQRKAVKELSSFSPINGGFHQPNCFRRAALQNIDLKHFFWEIASPYELRTINTNGKLFLRNKLFVRNKTGKFKFIKIKTKLFNSPSFETYTMGVDDNNGNEITVNTPGEINGDTLLLLEITDRRNGNLLSTRIFPVCLDYSPLKINLTKPFYRNCIFASQSIDRIEGQINTDLNSRDGVILKIKLADTNGKVIAVEEIKDVKPVNGFSIPVKGIKNGRYQLEANLKKESESLFSKQITIRKLPPHKSEVRIDKNLVTLVNGKPFLPYGWFSFLKDISKAGKQGYNVHVSYNAYYKSDSKLKKWLDKNLENGLKVMIYPYPKRSYNNTESWAKPLSKIEASEIRAFVRKWKNHPALLSWYMADEPELRPALVSRMEAIRKICMDEDPYHPCVLLNDTINGIHKYINGADIMNPDPYPLFIKDGKAAKPISKVSKFVEEIAVAGNGQKGAWVTPQGFNYGDFGRVNNRAPNFRELRNMQYQSIIAGATGFTWYTYYKAKPYPALILGVKFLCEEAKLLKEVILSPQKRIVLKTSDKDIKAVYYKDIYKNDWIIAVNNATMPKNIKITLPSGAPSKWYVLSEGKDLKTKGNNLCDEFEYYDANIYTTSPEHAKKLSIFKTNEMINNSLDD